MAHLPITEMPDRDHLLTGTLYGCSIMRLAIFRQCHVSVHASPTYSHLQHENAGGPWGDVTSTTAPVSALLKEDPAQCWLAPAAASAQH